MRNAIIYTRVSTDEQADRGYSLRDQKDRLEKYCAIKGIRVINHFEEDHSAKTFKRPEFKKLMDFIRKNRSAVDMLLFVKWDRFSRNTVDSYMMLRELTKLGVEANAVEQPIDLSVPENKLMLSFYLTSPEVENDRRALNTSAGMRRAKKEGRYVTTAPFGYKYDRDLLKKPILVKTPKAELVKEAFELYATGLYDKEEIRKQLRTKGMSLSKSAFWKILQNELYCGLIRVEAYKNEAEHFVKGLHEPIVSEELFRRVQDVVSNKRRVKAKPKKVNEVLPMRGYLVCHRCGKNLTGSASKGNGGIYHYYHCQPGCKERHKADFVHEDFDMWLDSLTIKPEIAELYLAVVQDIFKTEEGDRDKEIVKLNKQISDDERSLVKATEKFVNEDLDKFGYETYKNSITGRITELKRRLHDLEQIDDEFNAYMKYGMSLLSNLRYYYDEADLEGKRKFLGLMFPEKLVYRDQNYRTNGPNDLIGLLVANNGDFSLRKQKKAEENSDLFRKVARRGIEPLLPE